MTYWNYIKHWPKVLLLFNTPKGLKVAKEELSLIDSMVNGSMVDRIAYG